MAYCRFSTDDHQCDLYVYESTSDEWVIHVARNRPVFTTPLPPPVDPSDIEASLARHVAVSEMLADAEFQPIGLPLDGESYYEASPGDAADRLTQLAEAGYRFPQGIIAELREEQADLDASART